MKSRQYDRRFQRRDCIGGIASRPTPLPHITPSANPPPMTDTSRLDELEIRIAHQDQTIEDLNAAITAQWKLIERLEREVARLSESVTETERSTGEAAPLSEPPPHY